MHLETGLPIRHYVLDGRLGSGASGEVWRAWDGTGVVAIKFMNEQLVMGGAADHYRRCLETEIRVLGLLRHRHIPALLDHDLNCERPYLVMEYSGGQTLDRLIHSGEIFGIDMQKRLWALDAIASAIAACHAAGVIHRDIKPAHLSGINEPYLLDFSVALERRDIPQAREGVGTALYLPAPGEPPDELRDHFSFALTAYEILFGRHAVFTAADMGCRADDLRGLAAERLRDRTWRLPSRIPRPELPGDLYGADLDWLDGIFERALGPRQGRYGDLSRFVADLRGAILTASNQPYLDNPLRLAYLPSFAAPPIPIEDAYTLDEVARSARDTDHACPTKPASWRGRLRAALGRI
jgi:serine/threonine protein kinase